MAGSSIIVTPSTRLWLPMLAFITIAVGLLTGWTLASGLVGLVKPGPPPLPTQTPYVITATPASTPTSSPEPSATLTPVLKSIVVENAGPFDVTAHYVWRNALGTPTLSLDQIIVPRESVEFVRGSKYAAGLGP